MIVNLNRNSWHSKFYKFVKGYYPTFVFKSLCPYFWTIISFIVFLPLILLYKIGKTSTNTVTTQVNKLNLTKKPKESFVVVKPPSKISVWWNKRQKIIIKTICVIYLTLTGLFLLYMLGLGLLILFKEKGIWMTFIHIFAFIGAFFTTMLAIWGIASFFMTDTWKMIMGMIYSSKNKVCPAIDWEDK
jgi:hypothetical protein